MSPVPAVGTRASVRPGAAYRRRLLRGLALLLLVLLTWLSWPYVTLWRLDRALIRDDQTALARLVDLDGVRNELRRGLDKDAQGTLGPPSERFIDWLVQTLRRGGSSALDEAVSLAWVREQLLAKSPPGAGLRPAVRWAFFVDPTHFVVLLGGASSAPVMVRLRLTMSGWRVSALSY